MKRSFAVKALAVVSSLTLGTAVVWYQSSLIRGTPTPAPAEIPHTAPMLEPAAPSSEQVNHDGKVPNMMGRTEGRIPQLHGEEAPQVKSVPYFNPSKSASGMLPVIPPRPVEDAAKPGESAPAHPPVEDDGGESSTGAPSHFSTSKSGILFIPVAPPASVTEANE